MGKVKTVEETSAEAEALYQQMVREGYHQLKQERFGVATDYEFAVSTTESGDEKIIVRQWFRRDPKGTEIPNGGTCITRRYVTRLKKMLACGGVRNGSYLTEEDGKRFGYVRYNCGVTGQRWNPQWPKSVLVASDHFSSPAEKNPVPNPQTWFNG